ncbi:MAG: hypothetical protein ACRDMV_23080 [Streptosporangiales bacterium]
MEIIEPDYAQQAIDRVAAGEDLDTVWNTSPHRDLTADDIGLDEDGRAVGPEALRNYADAEYKRSLHEPGDDEAVSQQPSVFDHDLVHEEIRRQALQAEDNRMALDDERLEHDKEIAP